MATDKLVYTRRAQLGFLLPHAYIIGLVTAASALRGAGVHKGAIPHFQQGQIIPEVTLMYTPLPNCG